MNNTTAQNNTAVVPLVGGQATMSNIFHGSCHAASDPNSNCTTTGTQLTGTKDISNNYIDDSGGSAFYSNSFKVGGSGSALAWTCGGNKRMTLAPRLAHVETTGSNQRPVILSFMA